MISSNLSPSPTARNGVGPVWEAWRNAAGQTPEPKAELSANSEPPWSFVSTVKGGFMQGLTVAVGVPILTLWTVLILMAALGGTAIRYAMEGGDRILRR